MQSLDDILKNASAAIEATHFKLPVFGGANVRRERVYCYELYYQMRARWFDNEFVLNAEVDKSGASAGFPSLGRLKPDFVVHIPGSRTNYAAIEVKPIEMTYPGLAKDFRSLNRLLAAEYERGVLLVFGGPFTTANRQMVRDAAAAAVADDRIELWNHSAAGEKASCQFRVSDLR